MHAAVAKRTFWSKNVQNTAVSDHFSNIWCAKISENAQNMTCLDHFCKFWCCKIVRPCGETYIRFGFQHTSAGNRCRMMHSFKRLPPVITSTEDKNIGILCSDWPMVALWKIVEIGRYEGVLCVSSDRRHSRPEDQAPDLLQMTEKRCTVAMAYLLWHLIIASVRRTRSLHTVQQVCTFHWLPCVSLLTASAHAKSIKWIMMDKCVQISVLSRKFVVCFLWTNILICIAYQHTWCVWRHQKKNWSWKVLRSRLLLVLLLLLLFHSQVS